MQWKSRNLTHIGRLTIVKTLLITKLNHLILILLNTKMETIKDFENDLYNFNLNTKNLL